MLNFYDTDYLLYAIILIPILLGLVVLSQIFRKGIIQAYIPKKDLRDLLIPQRVGLKRIFRDILLVFSVCLVLLALARPQSMGVLSQQEEEKGIELMLCVDVSNSMLSPDVKPSRMSFAKHSLSRLLSRISHSKVGIVVFAADAYVQLPITTDLRTAQEFLMDLSPEMLSAQGTNIAQAIELSRTAFSDRKDIGKAIIVVTDGENQEGEVEEAARLAAKAGVKVFVVGVGTSQGGMIPIDGGYLKDPESGQTVVTSLNADMCRQIAQAGEGVYVNTASTQELLNILEDNLHKLPQASIGQSDRSGYIEHYALYLVPAILLLIIELFISQRRNSIFSRISLFGDDTKH